MSEPKVIWRNLLSIPENQDTPWEILPKEVPIKSPQKSCIGGWGEVKHTLLVMLGLLCSNTVDFLLLAREKCVVSFHISVTSLGHLPQLAMALG